MGKFPSSLSSRHLYIYLCKCKQIYVCICSTEFSLAPKEVGLCPWLLEGDLCLPGSAGYNRVIEVGLATPEKTNWVMQGCRPHRAVAADLRLANRGQSNQVNQ